jgi:hypothetical protein
MASRSRLALTWTGVFLAAVLFFATPIEPLTVVVPMDFGGQIHIGRQRVVDCGAIAPVTPITPERSSWTANQYAELVALCEKRKRQQDVIERNQPWPLLGTWAAGMALIVLVTRRPPVAGGWP